MHTTNHIAPPPIVQVFLGEIFNDSFAKAPMKFDTEVALFQEVMESLPKRPRDALKMVVSRKTFYISSKFSQIKLKIQQHIAQPLILAFRTKSRSWSYRYFRLICLFFTHSLDLFCIIKRTQISRLIKILPTRRRGTQGIERSQQVFLKALDAVSLQMFSGTFCCSGSRKDRRLFCFMNYSQ